LAAAEGRLPLREYLSVPYVLEVQSFPGADGSWRRCASFPELGAVSAEGESPVEVIEAAERARIRCIVERLARGEPVAVPRPPLSGVDVESLLASAGLEDWAGVVDEQPERPFG
jgi:predicted RNase H-like HicB family nuclease